MIPLTGQFFIGDEFERWQQGGCGTYATALIQAYPHLRLGAIDFWDTSPDAEFDCVSHFVAHDDHFAYDSCGRWPLPHQGLPHNESGRWLPDIGTPDHFGLPDAQATGYGDTTFEQDLIDALDHFRRHRIMEGFA